MREVYAVSGRACPVYIGGCRYRSIFEAADITEISFVSLEKSFRKNNGGPAVVKKQMAVTEFWINQRGRR
jgi:hypothetical protein